MDQHTKLVSALIKYDEQESKKKFYNRYAMGIYLQGLKNFEDELGNGVSPRRAMLSSFCGRLADRLLTTIGEPKMNQDEKRGLLPEK